MQSIEEPEGGKTANSHNPAKWTFRVQNPDQSRTLDTLKWLIVCIAVRYSQVCCGMNRDVDLPRTF
jgi:hypothetical protein